jgi:pimeloyl-ACP methyl ester carboxylesterase
VRTPREGQVELPSGGSLAWREWGDPAGRPVVFLHGTPGSRLFSPDPAETFTSGVRLFTFDRPGYGRSSPAAVPTLAGVAELVAQLADHRGAESPAVVGFSGGGPHALACGALVPDRVSRVAAVSSWGPIDELEAASASLTTAEHELVAAIRADPGGATELLWKRGQWYVDTPLRFLETPPDPADEPVLTDPGVRSNLAASNLEGARQGQAGLVADWVADALPWGFRLADIGVPVDLWVGERDPGRAPLDASEIQRRIPSCSLHSVPEAGHWLVISHWASILERSLS